jgi:hypothetical protein
MIFERAGEPQRVVKAGEAFWEPGGDAIHYHDGNNLPDAETAFHPSVPPRFAYRLHAAASEFALVLVGRRGPIDRTGRVECLQQRRVRALPRAGLLPVCAR